MNSLVPSAPIPEEVDKLLASFEGATPGPWKTDKPVNGWAYIRPMREGATEPICNMVLVSDEEKANAALIVAAPQLSERLRALSADHARLGEELEQMEADRDSAYITAGNEFEGLQAERDELIAERDRLTAQLSAQSAEVERLQRAAERIKSVGDDNAHGRDDAFAGTMYNLATDALATSPAVSDEQGEVK